MGMTSCVIQTASLYMLGMKQHTTLFMYEHHMIAEVLCAVFCLCSQLTTIHFLLYTTCLIKQSSSTCQIITTLKNYHEISILKPCNPGQSIIELVFMSELR
jgi:hypothetical protein